LPTEDQIVPKNSENQNLGPNQENLLDAKMAVEDLNGSLVDLGQKPCDSMKNSRYSVSPDPGLNFGEEPLGQNVEYDLGFGGFDISRDQQYSTDIFSPMKGFMGNVRLNDSRFGIFEGSENVTRNPTPGLFPNILSNNDGVSQKTKDIQFQVPEILPQLFKTIESPTDIILSKKDSLGNSKQKPEESLPPPGQKDQNDTLVLPDPKNSKADSKNNID
jgi:hypothetical protein